MAIGDRIKAAGINGFFHFLAADTVIGNRSGVFGMLTMSVAKPSNNSVANGLGIWNYFRRLSVEE
jgi:hypothetical protein